MPKTYPESAPTDWLAFRAMCRGPREMRSVSVYLLASERDAFFYRCYTQGQTPAAVLKSFVAAYLDGAPAPSLFAPACTGRASGSLSIPVELHERLRARAHEKGASISDVLRRFVLAYNERAECAA
jgi:hypothetical protein